MPNNGYEFRAHRLFILAVDLCLVFLAYVAAFYLRYHSFPERNWDSFLSLSPWILLIALFFLSVYELYAPFRRSMWDMISKVLVSVTFMSLVTMAASFLFREFALPRSVILIAYVLIILFLIAWKTILISLSARRRSGKVLLIGEEEAKKMITQIKHPLFKAEATKVKHVHPNTSIERINHLIRHVDYVVLCPDVPREKNSEIIYEAIKYDKIVYVIPTLYELLMSRSSITSIDDTMVMSVRPFGLTLDQQVIKRAFDIGVSFFLCILLLPLFLLIGLCIKLEDPKGSIIYKQKRVGKDNKTFTIYKFRSMVEGAENQTGPVLASEDDDRITRVGKWMRAMRIDELPQLFNVLKGDMSLVGPRPERPFFIKQLSKQYQNYHYRSTVKPGITGYAQIMGKYSTDVEDKLRYDLYYIRSYSFWLDLVIILRTFIVLLDKTRAEGTQDERDKRKKKSRKSKDIFLGA